MSPFLARATGAVSMARVQAERGQALAKCDEKIAEAAGAALSALSYAKEGASALVDAFTGGASLGDRAAVAVCALDAARFALEVAQHVAAKVDALAVVAGGGSHG